MTCAPRRVEEDIHILRREEEGQVPAREEEDVFGGGEEEEFGGNEQGSSSLRLWLAMNPRHWQISERWCLSWIWMETEEVHARDIPAILGFEALAFWQSKDGSESATCLGI